MAPSPPLPGLAGPADTWMLPPGWGWTGHADSASPASSSDSSGSCPCDAAARRPSRAEPPARGGRPARAEAPSGRARPAPSGGQRRSASEREKLRMRTLARALHELRRFLPPSVAPAGQSLTKIETLRLAIRYIGHLSAVLGLGAHSPARRRRRRSDALGPRGCPLCPDAAPAGPVALGIGVPDVGPWGTPPGCPGPQSPPHLAGARASDAALWPPPQVCPGPQTPPEFGSQPTPWTPPPAPLDLAARYQGVSVSPESCLPPPETPPLLPRPACRSLQPQPQPQWAACWGPGAPLLLSPGDQDQGLGPAFQLGEDSPAQGAGLRLGGDPELWQEDLDGPHLRLFC